MEMPDYNTIVFKRAQIIEPNLEGRPTRYSPSGGYRFFSVLVTAEEAEVLRLRGVRVGEWEGRGFYVVVTIPSQHPDITVLPRDIVVFARDWAWKDNTGTKLYLKND